MTASSDPFAPDELLKRLASLITQVDALDLHLPEDSAVIGLADEFAPEVNRLLHEGMELLDEISEAYQGESGDEPGTAGDEDSDSLGAIGRLIAAEIAAQEVGDFAFFARSELRTCLDALVNATRQRKQLLLASSCESGLRRLARALQSVESAICEYDGLEPPTRRHRDLEVSLRIRRLYANLRRAVTGVPSRGRTMSLQLRLRTVLFHMVALRELSIYPFLRFDDRVHLRELLRRILGWLNDDRRTELEGRRVWGDLIAFAALLAEVRYREELREHDREIVDRAWRALAAGTDLPAEVPRSLRQELEELLGLDDELDGLVLAPAPPPAEQWLVPLARLRHDLSGS